MPIIHVQLGARGRAPDGEEVAVPSSVALRERGPIVEATLTVAQPIATQVLQRGEHIPAPIRGLALIDTGASITCVDDAAARRAGAPVVDVARMHSASDSEYETNVYPVRFEVGGWPMALDAPRAFGANLGDQDLILLIDRDLLQRCTLHYNGPSGVFTLAI